MKSQFWTCGHVYFLRMLFCFKEVMKKSTKISWNFEKFRGEISGKVARLNLWAQIAKVERVTQSAVLAQIVTANALKIFK